MRFLAILGLVCALAGQAPAAPRASLIGVYVAPQGLTVDGAPFGGVSGIDYDVKRGVWLLISDDRSDRAPARFHVAHLVHGGGAAPRLTIDRSAPLRREDGSTFPSPRSAEGERADAESIRVDPLTGILVWASEGDPGRGFSPSLRRMDIDGAPAGAIALPADLSFDPSGGSGARPNLTTEGLSFTPDGRALWVSIEAPLIQDGPVASVRAGALIRVTRLDRQGVAQAQYPYRLDPIQAAPAAGKRADNGVSEILAVDDNRLLVLERSGVETAEGRFVYHCRLYLVDTRGAVPIAPGASLSAGTPALDKRLIVNFDRLPGAPPRNLEAMAWGPDSPGGDRTLVLASDDNFDPEAPGVILVLTVKGL